MNRFSYEMIKDKIKNMSGDSEVINENPTMILIKLPQGFKGEPEVHEDDDDLYIVLEGEGRLRVEDNQQDIAKGDLIHIPAKQTHQLVHTEKGIIYIVVKIRQI